MNVHTRNTIYTLTDAGDGAFLISGHRIYCPEPLLVTLVEPPRIGRCLIFRPVDLKIRRMTNHVITTPVVMIRPSRDMRPTHRDLDSLLSRGPRSAPVSAAQRQAAE
jgi:hypothetical protein